MADAETTRQLERELADELMRIHRQSYGTDGGTPRVHLLEDMVIFVVDDLELLRNEEFLLSAGEANAVVETRSRYQSAIEMTFRSAVERATGRRVVSFASATRLSPHWLVEIFRLSPAAPISEGSEPA